MSNELTGSTVTWRSYPRQLKAAFGGTRNALPEAFNRLHALVTPDPSTMAMSLFCNTWPVDDR